MTSRPRNRLQAITDNDSVYQLVKEGNSIHKIEKDGNCLFRALAHQLFGNDEKHLDIRRALCTFIRGNEKKFAPFLIRNEGDDVVHIDVYINWMKVRKTFNLV